MSRLPSPVLRGGVWAGRASCPLVSSSVKGPVLAKFDPVGFVREVRQEVGRVTWPSRKETLVTTLLVLGLSALAALFFMLIDWIIAGAMRLLFGLGV
jgi:preprotein translocase subunit SecE